MIINVSFNTTTKFALALDAVRSYYQLRDCRETDVMKRLHLQSSLYVLISSVKGRRTNFKTEVTRKQSMPNFLKNERSLPPETHTYVSVSGGKK